MLAKLQEASADCVALICRSTEDLVIDIMALYRYTVADATTILELRTYDPHGPRTTVAVHDKKLGIDLSPRLSYGFEELTFVVKRTP